MLIKNNKKSIAINIELNFFHRFLLIKFYVTQFSNNL